MTEKSKLGRALQDAALANINEDIQSICDNLEKITNEIPEEVRKQLVSLNEDINSLSLGLKAVPEQFDLDFSKKINRILDVAADIEAQTKKHQQSLSVDLENLLSNYVDKINAQLAKKIKDNFIIKDTTLYFTLFITALLGGLVGSSFIAFIVMKFL